VTRARKEKRGRARRKVARRRAVRRGRR